MLGNSNKTIKKDQKYVRILNTDVLSTSLQEVLTGISSEISHNKKEAVFTPNPEFVLLASQNPLVKSTTDNVKYMVPDGVGLKFASIFLYGKGIDIIPGRKLFLELIKLADKNGWRLYFLGGTGKEAGLAALKLGKTYKNLSIKYSAGPMLNVFGQPVTEKDISLQSDIVKEINLFKPNILVVAFGNPKQEIWIKTHLPHLNTNIALTVGGAFRQVAGLVKDTPPILEKLGMEWLWRGIQEPTRIKRLMKAVFIFPLKVFASRFK
jgi:N-acetylglucosaminyldiphosphoundecaprenol N-acetyl-beta-D-mannosaminyltransferase